MSNIIHVRFNGCLVTQTETLFQWDYGRALVFDDLELPLAYEVQFANERYGGETVTQIGNEDGVAVPDVLLTTGKPVYAFLYLHDGEDDGYTERVVTMPVSRRGKPTNATPTPVQQDAITEAIAALQEAERVTGENVTLSAGYAEEAEDSAEDSEAWAVGQRDGVDVPSTDETYQNNAKFYASESLRYQVVTEEYKEEAYRSKLDAEQAKEDAQGYASDASGYADNAHADAQRAEDAVAHNPTIINGTWWVWNPTLNAYVDTHVQAQGEKGNVMFATFAVEDGYLNMYTDPEYTGANFAINNAYLEVII